MRILMIRHGDPDYENDCLTEKGRREAELLAERLSQEKIDAIYTSPLGRAYETCMYTAKAIQREKDVVVLDWLKEFSYPVTLSNGSWQNRPWDILPQLWVNNDGLYDYKNWTNQGFYQETNVVEQFNDVTQNLDALLKEYGYCRQDNYYSVKNGNTKTIALFCHFGLEGVLLSRLLNISPFQIWHHFVALTSSVTTLYTEERRKGVAVFRCAGFGDIGHLYKGKEPPSFSARFCENYGDGTRED